KAALPELLQRAVAAGLIGQQQQQERPGALCTGGVVEYLDAFDLPEPWQPLPGLGCRLCDESRQARYGVCADALAPAADPVQRNCQREVVADRGDRVATMQGPAQWTAVSRTQTARAIQRGVAEQLDAAAAFPAHAARHDARRRLSQPRTQGRIARQQQAAFVDRQTLAGRQAEEADVAGQSHADAVVTSAQRLRGILDH